MRYPTPIDYEVTISFPKINSNYELQRWEMWNGTNDNKGFTVHNDRDHACACFKIKDIFWDKGLTNEAMHNVFIRCIDLVKHITDGVMKHMLIYAITQWFWKYSNFIVNYSKGVAKQANLRDVEYSYESEQDYPNLKFSAKCIERN